MTTTTKPPAKTTEGAATPSTGEIPIVTIGTRVAADLRVLADIAAAHPELAAQIAPAVAQLHIVLPTPSALVVTTSTLTPEDFGDALEGAGATAVEPDSVEALWSTSAWRLPAGAVTLDVTLLSVPALDPAS